MRKLLGKLRNVKNALKIFHKNNTSRISERVATTSTAWNLAQINLDKDPNNEDLQDREHRAACLFASLSRDEEAILKQKSRVQWLQLGDKNTCFFHKSILHRQTRNRIISLKDDAGNQISNSQIMGTMAATHFENLLITHPVMDMAGQHIPSLFFG
ncbi:hypothetical protein OIU78_029846 [Salix suchowensis]|nr:hypothetical protein OIU78_029846 [Salix suchowensis]